MGVRVGELKLVAARVMVLVGEELVIVCVLGSGGVYSVYPSSFVKHNRALGWPEQPGRALAILQVAPFGTRIDGALVVAAGVRCLP